MRAAKLPVNSTLAIMVGNMKWFSIYKDGQPNNDQRVLTYSECYKGRPELAFRLIGGQFVRLCTEVTHYSYLREPDNLELDKD